MSEQQTKRAEKVLLAALAAMVNCGVSGDDIRAAWETTARELGLKPGETICLKCGQRQQQEGPPDDILF